MEKQEIYVLKNKPLPEGAMSVIENMAENGEEVLFTIVGDMTLSGKYAETALIFTKDAVTYFCKDDQTRKISFADMENVKSKRMYGNATLSAVMPNGKREIFFRYTYSVASLCDSAAMFITHLSEGAYSPKAA